MATSFFEMLHFGFSWLIVKVFRFIVDFMSHVFFNVSYRSRPGKVQVSWKIFWNENLIRISGDSFVLIVRKVFSLVIFRVMELRSIDKNLSFYVTRKEV
jgi:hypothetical protein